jgi:endo-1,4-beta-xylanase
MTSVAGCRHLRRRDILAGALALPFAGVPKIAASEITDSLGEIARRKGLLFGTACLLRHIDTDPTYVDLLKNECRILVTQDDLKWIAIRQTPDRFDFSRVDALLAFAESMGAQMRGHTLVWHDALPEWCLERIADKRTASHLLTEHIATVCGRYRGRMHSWDVVNEAVEPDDERTDGLRETPWLRALGSDYVGEAFRIAAAVDPSAMLVYNEYGICDTGRKACAKRAAVLSLLDRLAATRAPVHALGVQAHLRTSMTFDERELRTFLDEIAHRGLRVMITELDVLDEAAASDPMGQDDRVANTYKTFLDIVLTHPATVACITWGLSDRYSWLRFGDHGRVKGELRPLLYDEGYQPKPAWHVIAEVLSGLADRR